VANFERLSAYDLNTELKSDKPPYVIDVRTEAEFADKRIEGTVNIPLNKLNKRLNEVPRDRRLVIHCLGGYRSMIAASILAANGYEDLTDLVGGINSWIEDSLPVLRQPTGAASCT
jgi:rhodanese-related sulfurtransferase